MQAVQGEWPELIAKVRAEKDKGTPPEDPGVQALAARWMELVEMFTGGFDYVNQACAVRKGGTSA